jgi:4-hydroxy-2-oxoheptanedioate aldolase
LIRRFPERHPVPSPACLLRSAVLLAAVAVIPRPSFSQSGSHLNPVVDLLAQKKAVFGLYAPANRRGRGAPPPDAPPPRTPAQLAADALSNTTADYLFDGTMEGNFERGYGPFVEFMKAMGAAGTLKTTPTRRLHLPMFVKMHEIAPDPALAAKNIARQLDLGVAGIVFVGVESPDEVRTGIAAMRFAAAGGTRPNQVGSAASMWGMTDEAYRQKADVWPLNPMGELVNFTIVESRAGLERIREIAAVPGIGVLFPGAGTLRGVFTTTDANGQRVFDEKGWEAAIQQVLAACKEFRVACGYPASENDIETRMKQGFSVFVIGWGEPGFRAVDIGRRVAGRE